jgi:hypothetical protein
MGWQEEEKRLFVELLTLVGRESPLLWEDILSSLVLDKGD